MSNTAISHRPTPRRRALRVPRRRVAIAAIALLGALAAAVPAVAMTSHAGWPANQHLVMDKGPAGRHNTLVGIQGRHNYLLGGYGDDTIYGGDAGDVIWGDYHPSGESTQTAVIHAGDGKNFIYSNDSVNFVWTGTNPATVVHAHEGSGVIHCENAAIVVFTSHHALPHYKLDGCRHISLPARPRARRRRLASLGEVVALSQVGDQARVGRLPAEQLAGQGA